MQMASSHACVQNSITSVLRMTGRFLKPSSGFGFSIFQMSLRHPLGLSDNIDIVDGYKL